MFEIGDPSKVVVLFESSFKVVVKVVLEGNEAMLRSKDPELVSKSVLLFESYRRRRDPTLSLGFTHSLSVKFVHKISLLS